MRIAVLMKQVPKGTDLKMNEETGTLIRSGADQEVNGCDLYALETALRIRETIGGEITALTMGADAAAAVLKEAYALGADQGILVSDPAFAGADVCATAYTLKGALEQQGGFDLVLCGRQTTDGDTAQTGPEISAMLGIPHAAWVNGIVKVTKSEIIVMAKAEEYIETVQLPYPCLLTIEKDISPLRLPNLKQKLAARKKPVKIIGLSDLKDQNPEHYGLAGSPTQVVRLFSPEVSAKSPPLCLSPPKAAEAIRNKIKELTSGESGGEAVDH